MLKRSQIFLILTFITILVFSLFLYLNFHKKLRVAHAGGQYNGKNYSNSIEAIEHNLKFVKYFELDLQLTKDKRLVCLHEGVVSNKYFNEIKNNIDKNNYCYDQTLKDFLYRNEKIKIITDFKSDNIEGLIFIKEYFKSNSDRFIPQIYYEKEYQKVKELGFEKIIFTFYKIPDFSNKQILKILDKMDLFALTLDPARLRSGLIKKIDKKNFFIYAHTVNSKLRFLQYKLFFGVDEIYTDNLF